MATEDLLINNGCDRQTVEAVGEGLPQLYVVPPLTCWWEENSYLAALLILKSVKFSAAVPVASHSKRSIIQAVNSKEKHVILCQRCSIMLLSPKPGVLRGYLCACLNKVLKE